MRIRRLLYGAGLVTALAVGGLGLTATSAQAATPAAGHQVNSVCYPSSLFSYWYGLGTVYVGIGREYRAQGDYQNANWAFGIADTYFSVASTYLNLCNVQEP